MTALWKPVTAALAIGALALIATVLAAERFDEPVGTFTRDVQVTAGMPWYTGALSLFTTTVWAGVTALAAFAAWLEEDERRRLGGLAALAALLMADDALQVHDEVGPQNGVPQIAFMVVYALAAAALSLAFLRRPRAAATAAFLLGAVFLGASVFVDQLLRHAFLLEDGAKLLGALVWLTVPVLSVRRPANG
ncbi:hypothetical protein ACI789_07915 [Geodermatophilus sp. SYSU D00965]